jgi:hypothetical protein
MSSNFDWHIGEEPDQQAPPLTAAQRPFRANKYLLITIAIAIGLITYLVLANRAKRVETAVTDDIIARFNLLWDAAQHQDKELFHSLRNEQSDNNWTQKIDALFAHNMLFDRQPFGLHLLPDQPQITDIIVSPDLQQATLLANLRYQTEVGLVTLQQAFAYEYQSESWQLSQPPASWWTDGDYIPGKRLMVLYHYEQDVALVERLADDLDSLGGTVCSRLTEKNPMRCPQHTDDFQEAYQPDLLGMIVFASNYYNFLEDWPNEPSMTIYLPAPTLIGLPVDDAGYEALRAGYARRLLHHVAFEPTAVFASDPRFAEAMLRQIMVTTGVRPWSPTTDMPTESIGLLCLNEAGSGLDVWGYDGQTAVWRTLHQIPTIQTIYRLPDGVVLVQTEQTWQLVWLDGVAVSLPAVPDAEIRPGGDGRQLLAITPAQTYQLDVAQCRQGDCGWQMGAAAAALSPDGAQQIRQTTQGLQRMGIRGEGAVYVGQGYAPFWINDLIYGYLRSQSTEVEIVAAHIADDVAYRLTTTTDLRAAIPNHEAVSALYITNVAARPDDFTSLLINAYAPAPLDREYTFSLYRITGEVVLVEQAETRPLGNLSPDGRYSTNHVYDVTYGRWTFSWSKQERAQTHTINFEQTVSPPLYTLAWADDSDTLALLYDGTITLIQLDSDNHQTITPPVPGCVDMAWLKAGMPG